MIYRLKLSGKICYDIIKKNRLDYVFFSLATISFQFSPDVLNEANIIRLTTVLEYAQFNVNTEIITTF